MATHQINPFKKATKKQLKLRLALSGPSGSGKTYSALSIAKGLGKRIAVIDTERGSASLYSDDFEFDTINLDDVFGDYSPINYVKAINAAEDAGYDVIIIDSLSHAWIGKGGALEMHENAIDRQRTKNSYVAWREVTPAHNALVEAMIQSKAHIIATLRAKTAYVQEKEGDRTVVRKIGMESIQRDGLEYEFTLVGDMDDGKMVISKTRCKTLNGKVFKHPNGNVSTALKEWLESGAPEEAPAIADDDVTAVSNLKARFDEKLSNVTRESWAQGEKVWHECVEAVNKQAKRRGIGAMVVALKDHGTISAAVKALGDKIQECVDCDIAQKAQQLGGVVKTARNLPNDELLENSVAAAG